MGVVNLEQSSFKYFLEDESYILLLKTKQFCPAYLASHYIINTHLALDEKDTLLQQHQSDYNYAEPTEGEDNQLDDIQFHYTGLHQDL